MALRWMLLGTLLLSAPTSLMGEGFRIETDVFVEDDPQPVAETLTLFYQEDVYDFVLTEPREITVFDVQRGRITLLDPEREIKTTLTTDELLEFAVGIQARTDGEQKKLFGKDFDVQVDDETGEITLAGRSLTYRAKGLLPKQQEAVAKYRAFADWYARLNAMRPGNPPPFGRLEVNRELSKRGFVPQEIVRTLTLPGRLTNTTRTAKSRHAYTWILSTTDRKRIQDAGVSLVTYKASSRTQYFRLDRVADRD